MSEDDDFLSRWSRRKRTPREAPDIAAAEAPDDAGPPADAEADERTDAEILASLGLRDPDTLGLGDDFKAYLQAAVPAHIRRRALRRLWRSNPVLAVRDGLNDYDFDVAPGTIPKGTLKTAYKVGRGFARMAAESAAGEADADPALADDDHREAGDVHTDSDRSGTVEADPPKASIRPPASVSPAPPNETAGRQVPPQIAEEDDPATSTGPARRRMVFRTFDEDSG